MNDSAVRCQSREELCPQAKSILLTSTTTNAPFMGAFVMGLFVKCCGRPDPRAINKAPGRFPPRRSPCFYFILRMTAPGTRTV